MTASEQARYKGMLESLQTQDADIDHIVAYSKFVVAYLLQQEGQNPGWRKANIEGPVYVVRRNTNPRFQLLVKNQFSTTDLLDSLDSAWELDCQKNYVFYKVDDPSKRIRGLWFHDDNERLKLETSLEKVLDDIRNNRDPAPDPGPSVVQQVAPKGESQTDALYEQFGLQKPGEGGGAQAGETVPITFNGLRAALHSLADDDTFLNMVMGKLKDMQGGKKM